MFTDGSPLPHYNANSEWRVATKIIIPSGTKVVAIHAEDIHGGKAGILGSFSNGQVTNATWKCHSPPVPSEWASAGFNDSSWPAAVEYWGQGTTKKKKNISDDAKWIWTSDNKKGSKVYCRVRLQWSSLSSKGV